MDCPFNSFSNMSRELCNLRIRNCISRILYTCHAMPPSANLCVYGGEMHNTEEQKAPLLVSKREAAAMLGVCLRSIDNYIGAKELPSAQLSDHRQRSFPGYESAE